MEEVGWWEVASKILIPVVFVMFGLIWKIRKESSEEIRDLKKEFRDAMSKAETELNKDIDSTRLEMQSMGRQILSLQLKIVETYPTKADLMETEQRIVDRTKLVLEAHLGKR